MSIRRTRFGTPADPDAVSEQERGRRADLPLDLSFGFNSGRRYTNLQPGESPEMQNFVPGPERGGTVQPRSGLSSYNGATGLGEHVVGGDEFFDNQGNWAAIIASKETFAHLDSESPSWNVLTDNGTRPTGQKEDGWDTAQIYDDKRDKNIGIFTNGEDLPKFAPIQTAAPTVSDYTESASAVSNAEAVTVLDERVVFGNIEEDSTQRGERVVWSARGKPHNWDNFGTEAGGVDLDQMEGDINAIVAQGDIGLIFSDQEVWQMRPRRDVFAFDFQPLTQELGTPFGRTVRQTPQGVFFLGQDLEIYRIAGGSVEAVGPRQPGESSRIQSHLQRNMVKGKRAWAAYNQSRRRYELYYATDTDEWAREALFYDMENDSFWVQRFSQELTHGFDFADTGSFLGGSTIDEHTETIDENTTKIDNVGFVRPPIEDRKMTTFTSDGTALRFVEGQITDDGEPIDSRWRSNGLRIDTSSRRHELSAVKMEYESESASSATVTTTDDGGVTFGGGIEKSLSSTRQDVEHFPVFRNAFHPQFELRTEAGDDLVVSLLRARLAERSEF